MALRIGKSELGGWKAKAMRARARLQSASKKADEVVETMVHTAEVGSAAFLSGLVQGRTTEFNPDGSVKKQGGVEVLGVPLDLGLAAGLHVFGFMGIGGKMSSHLHGFGDGFLASFLATTGVGVGSAMAQKSAGVTASLPAPAASGYLGPGARLTEADRRMAAMAAAI